MSIPELKKIKSEKKYHNTTLKDDYSWVDQPDILDVLKNPNKLHPEVKKYIEENIDLTPKGIIDRFGLFKYNEYSKNCVYGHFGDKDVPWEKIGW